MQSNKLRSWAASASTAPPDFADSTYPDEQSEDAIAVEKEAERGHTEADTDLETETDGR